MLGKLHRGQMLHRDLTPMNVFVCDGRRLKLGDFGIVRQQSDRRGITARTLNPLTAPSDILAGAAPKWQARDDVYQVGQLLGMLVKGDARARIRTQEIRLLPCSDHLKEIVYRCIGERRKRYESADELIEALRNPPGRAEGGRAALAEGRSPRVHGHPEQAPRATPCEPPGARARSFTAMPSARTTVVVRGRPNPRQAAGRDAGLKLMEIKRLRDEGAPDHAAQRDAVLAPGGPAVTRGVLGARALNRTLLTRQLLQAPRTNCGGRTVRWPMKAAGYCSFLPTPTPGPPRSASSLWLDPVAAGSASAGSGE